MSRIAELRARYPLYDTYIGERHREQPSRRKLRTTTNTDRTIAWQRTRYAPTIHVAPETALHVAKHRTLRATTQRLGATLPDVLDWKSDGGGGRDSCVVNRDGWHVRVTLTPDEAAYSDTTESYGEVSTKWSEGAIVVSRNPFVPTELDGRRSRNVDRDTPLYYHPPRDARSPRDYEREGRHESHRVANFYDRSDMWALFEHASGNRAYLIVSAVASDNGVEFGTAGLAGVEIDYTLRKGMREHESQIEYIDSVTNDVIQDAIGEAEDAARKVRKVVTPVPVNRWTERDVDNIVAALSGV